MLVRKYSSRSHSSPSGRQAYVWIWWSRVLASTDTGVSRVLHCSPSFSARDLHLSWRHNNVMGTVLSFSYSPNAVLFPFDLVWQLCLTLNKTKNRIIFHVSSFITWIPWGKKKTPLASGDIFTLHQSLASGSEAYARTKELVIGSLFKRKLQNKKKQRLPLHVTYNVMLIQPLHQRKRRCLYRDLVRG